MQARAQILRHLQERDLVAFVGAGASRSIHGPNDRITYRGLPDAHQLVATMAERVGRITPEMCFEDAAYLFHRSVGDREYVRFFKDHLDPPDISPLPAHHYLAMLPFTSYVSMNFDRLLERALTEANQQFEVIRTESDLYAPNVLTRRMVLKPHGCISQPETIVASTDELVSYAERAPFIDALLRVLLTNTPALFAGFSLRDPDFRMLILNIRRSYKTFPRSFAIVRNPTAFDVEFWAQHEIDLFDGDLTEFLGELAREWTGEEFPIHLRKLAFLDDPMFAALAPNRLRSLPTETEVIEAFLDGFSTRLIHGAMDITPALDEAQASAEKVYKDRPNYKAFRTVTTRVLEAIKDTDQNNPGATFNRLMEIRRERQQISTRIQSAGRHLLTPGDNILVFSQSVRVREVLLAVPPMIQAECTIYIGECRPKSPRVFVDAALFAETLKGSRYILKFVTDVAMTTMISQRAITKVILGAHAIHVSNDETVLGFVNTCGSLQLALACEKFDIPLFVIAERDKFTVIDSNSDNISIAQEERLSLPSDIGLPAEVAATLARMPIINIGYDFVPASSMIQFISD